MAVNCSVVPSGMLTVAGVTAMEVSTGAVTVSVEDPKIVPDFAVIVVTPCARLVVRPPVLTVATLAKLEVHVAEVVNVFAVPSV